MLTEADFWTYCDARKIIVRFVQLEQPGYSVIRKVRPKIYLSDELRGEHLLQTMFHEIAHHFLHAPGIQFFCGTNSKIEFEANVVAACALIPKPLLSHHWPSEIAEEYGYSERLIKFRQMLLQYWKI